MQKFLLLLNDACYGIERSYNALRLATALSRKENTEVRVFLMGDAVNCGKNGQKTPTGFYNVERMLQSLSGHGAAVGA
ncbi:MAG: ychN [Dehalococcoidia bacterium]|nr:ychN [Dehalococcoidia bacterium]